MTDYTAVCPLTFSCVCIRSQRIPTYSDVWTLVDKLSCRFLSEIKRSVASGRNAQCKAFGYYNNQGKSEVKEVFLSFSPNPPKSVEDLKTCKTWLENFWNAKRPRKLEHWEWNISSMVASKVYLVAAHNYLYPLQWLFSARTAGRKLRIILSADGRCSVIYSRCSRFG